MLRRIDLTYRIIYRHYNPRFVYFLPSFEVYLCTVTFGLMYGYYSRAVSNQERVIMARVRYPIFAANLL